MPTEAQATAYKHMMKVYDNLENIIKAAEGVGTDVDPYINHLKKLIETVEENVGMVMDKFLDHVETGRHVTNIEKLKIEKAVKEVNIAIDKFLNTIN